MEAQSNIKYTDIPRQVFDMNTDLGVTGMCSERKDVSGLATVRRRRLSCRQRCKAARLLSLAPRLTKLIWRNGLQIHFNPLPDKKII